MSEVQKKIRKSRIGFLIGKNPKTDGAFFSKQINPDLSDYGASKDPKNPL